MSVSACLEDKKADLRPVRFRESILAVKVIVQATKNDVRINAEVAGNVWMSIGTNTFVLRFAASRENELKTA